MSKARELAELGGVDGALSSRNMLINGGLSVWQRGISFTTGPTNTYTADRWISRDGSISKSADVPSGMGFMNSAYYQNAGVRAGINIRQVIEYGYYAMDGRDVTLSFWIKTSVTTNVAVDLHDAYSSGYILTCPANTWTYHTYTFSNVDTSTFTDYWSGPHAHIDFNFGGSYPDVYITGVQLEVGDTATPFEHEPYGVTLQKCQRFFFKHDFPHTSPFGPAHHQTSNTIRAVVHTPQPMRVTPTINASGQPSWYCYYDNGNSSMTVTSGDAWSVVASSLDNNRITLQATRSGLSGVIAGLFGYGGDFIFDAEL